MQFLLTVVAVVAACFVGCAALILPLRVRFVRELRRMSRGELESEAFRYEDEYFGVIGHGHPDVLLFRQLVEDKDLRRLRKEWPRLSRSFAGLERRSGHAGRPLIMDYYDWYELVLEELSKRER